MSRCSEIEMQEQLLKYLSLSWWLKFKDLKELKTKEGRKVKTKLIIIEVNNHDRADLFS